MRSVRHLTAEYNARLKSLGLRDYQVTNSMSNLTRGRAAGRFVGSTLLLLAGCVLWLPMTLLSVPLLIFTRSIASCKVRQAVAASSVKIYGRDVAATWKLIVALGLAPILWLIYTSLSGFIAERWTDLGVEMVREVQLLVFFLLPLLAYAYVLVSEQVRWRVRGWGQDQGQVLAGLGGWVTGSG